MLNIKFFCLNSNEKKKPDFCDVQYQFFFFFANLKKKDFCDVQY